MLTAYADAYSMEKALKLGAYAFITKPFDNTEIVSLIKKSLRKQ
jgi:FixJ family two-component response regulator